jgi:hypothetical protein
MDATHLFLTRKIEKPGGFVSLFPRKAQVHLIDDFDMHGEKKLLMMIIITRARLIYY